MKRTVIIALALIMLLSLCACADRSEDTIREEDIRAVCELATLNCYYNNVAKVNQEAENLFQKDREMWIEYEGEAVIGIQMSDVEINIAGTAVTITMPKAEILSTDYSFNENSFISSEDGWLFKNEISTETQQKAVIEAQEEMKQEISENKAIFLQAEARAKELIENYIHKLGEIQEQEYLITWVE